MNTDSDNSNQDPKPIDAGDHSDHTGDKSWFERNVNWIMAGLVIACIGTLVAQAICGPVFGAPFFDEKHPPHFDAETWFGFSAIFGFVAFIAVVMLGTLLRPLIRREEDYYD